MTFAPRPHFKRLYLTPDMAVSNQNMRVQRTQGLESGERPVRIDAWLDVCVTAVWQETDRFTNYCGGSSVTRADAAVLLTHKGDGLFSFSSCPNPVILSRVLAHLERWSVKAHHVEATFIAEVFQRAFLVSKTGTSWRYFSWTHTRT